jgi:phosphate starvation-inducible PhoH-like protein
MDIGVIEVVPLAYMRGRTLNDSFIILDEAQNASPEQMKMFLTRLGFGSKIVITGDITQIDLPDNKKSGLVQVRNILKNVKGIDFIYLTSKDVVRHSLVQKIVDAYKNYEEINKVENQEISKDLNSLNKYDDSKKQKPKR